jgi:hypothetical protein
MVSALARAAGSDDATGQNPMLEDSCMRLRYGMSLIKEVGPC